jgi:chemotaxis protein CheX
VFKNALMFKTGFLQDKGAVMKIKAEHVSPFIKSCKQTFATMLSTELNMGKLFVRQPGDKRQADISGMIGLSGDVKGAVVIGYPRETALKVVSRFIGEEVDDMNGDVSDAIGEITNIIAGYAKKDIGELNISISLPSVIEGNDHLIHLPKDIPIMCVPLSGDVGDFFIEVCMKFAQE